MILELCGAQVAEPGVESAGVVGLPTSGDDLLVGLAFSGGGTRTAAFSYGVLSELDRTKVDPTGQKVSSLDSIDYISGVSGGAVTDLVRANAANRISASSLKADR